MLYSLTTFFAQSVMYINYRFSQRYKTYRSKWNLAFRIAVYPQNLLLITSNRWKGTADILESLILKILISVLKVRTENDATEMQDEILSKEEKNCVNFSVCSKQLIFLTLSVFEPCLPPGCAGQKPFYYYAISWEVKSDNWNTSICKTGLFLVQKKKRENKTNLHNSLIRIFSITCCCIFRVSTIIKTSEEVHI